MSSAKQFLQSQTFNKRNCWAALQNLGIVSSAYSPKDSDRLIVEGWWIGVRVVLKRGVDHILEKTQKGFSTIVSWKAIFKAIFKDSWDKSEDISAEYIGENLFHVRSRQNPKEYHQVIARPTGVSCSCKKYQIIKENLHEVPSLKQQFKLSEEWKLERYDEEKGKLEATSSPFCHHGIRVIRQFFSAQNLQEYAWNYQEVVNFLESEKYRRC